MMSLKDVVSGANLATWSMVAMLMFFAIFIAIGLWTMSRSREDIDRWRHAPLEQDD